MSILLIFLLIATSATLAFGQGTRVGFYQRTCPRAESIVTSAVTSAFRSNSTIAPGLLRMHFHDCFVNGCDASVLIDGPNTEKTGVPNLLLRGFEVIDNAKAQIEAICPGVVSCADILALAARDSVVLTRGITWRVPTGRRDGLVSLASDTDILPGLRDSVTAQRNLFDRKGLSVQDLVALVGGHTIGTAACGTFSHRLQNFTADGGPDPTIAPAFLARLLALCPSGGDPFRRVPLDDGSEGRFDTSFFANLRNARGVLQTDQLLWGDASTRTLVQRFLGVRGSASLNFGVEFGRSMVKMSNIEVKTGTVGEIRRVCTAIN
ncbi:peroxidase [Lithospermum erythrorhizon]|uniref:Peroxidase n=1 Tax=Lithospermum erythrorhizon TaxID=34254 RepID=A0AAV3NU89_LITER